MMAMMQLRYQSSNKSETQRRLVRYLRFSSFPWNYFLFQGLRFMLSLALPNQCKKCVSHDVGYWADLPKDLLEVIFNHVKRSVGDLIRASAVCKSWQLVADSVRQLKDETGPFFLLLPPTKNIAHDKEQLMYHLFDFFKSKEGLKNIIVLPDSHDHYIYSSWNEWLVALSHDIFKSPIRFINLLSTSQVELPPHMLDLLVRRVILSTTPLDPNCVFMAICFFSNNLVFCKQGDKEWKIILRNNEGGIDYFYYPYKDVIYFKGEFYAVSNGGYLEVCRDIDSLEPKTLKVAPVIPKTTCHDTLYLVESFGDLLLVISTSEYNRNNVNGPSKTLKVYKLNFSKRKWQRVNSLRDNSALFVGPYLSMCVSAKDFPVKRDCVYFTNHYHPMTYVGDTNRCHDIGVFNLKTNLFEPTLLFSRKWPCQLFWVLPEVSSPHQEHME